MGYFDGVHLGHQFLIKQLRETAAKLHKQSLVITFDNHPRTVLHPDHHMPLLTTTQEKLLLLERQNIDACSLLHFTHEMAQISAKDFMLHTIIGHLGVDTLIVGYDHHFGHNTGECFNDYARYGKEIGLNVLPAEAMTLPNGDNISSSKIRAKLDAGDVEHAQRLLSRPYFITGTVTEGKQVGRTIGYPTANLKLYDMDKLIPHNGVYLVKTTINDVNSYYGLMNIGMRPTLKDGRGRTIETHLLNFNGNLYGAKMTAEFLSFIRPEKQFNSLTELQRQITLDKQTALNDIIRHEQQ